MARLPALIDLLLTFGGTDRKTLDLQARVLREAGLLTTGKRGTGAPHMSPSDAAVLLFATMATDSASTAPDTVLAYHALPRLPVAAPPPVGSQERQLHGMAARSPSALAFLRDLIARHAKAPHSGNGGIGIDIVLDRATRTVSARIAGRLHGGDAAGGTCGLAWSSMDPRRAACLMSREVVLRDQAIRQVARLVAGAPSPALAAVSADDDAYEDALSPRP